jgi:predicted enzyme related to lactoylglutathione lyase
MGGMTDTPIHITGVDFAYIPVTDFAVAKRFYSEVLGLTQSKQYGRMPGGEFETGTLTLQILQAEAFGQQFNRSPNPIALHVDDVHQARAQLESHGIEFLGETMDSGVCHMAFFRDPDGHALMLHHRYAPPEARPPGLE